MFLSNTYSHQVVCGLLAANGRIQPNGCTLWIYFSYSNLTMPRLCAYVQVHLQTFHFISSHLAATQFFRKSNKMWTKMKMQTQTNTGKLQERCQEMPGVPHFSRFDFVCFVSFAFTVISSCIDRKTNFSFAQQCHFFFLALEFFISLLFSHWAQKGT